MPKQYPRGEKGGNKSMAAPINANSRSNKKTGSSISFTSLPRAGAAEKRIDLANSVCTFRDRHASVGNRYAKTPAAGAGAKRITGRVDPRGGGGEHDRQSTGAHPCDAGAGAWLQIGRASC